MMRLNIQGNLLNRTEALEAGKAGIDVDNLTAAGKKNIVSLGMPNYSAGIVRSVSKNYTPAQNVLVVFYSFCSNNGTNLAHIYVNGVAIEQAGNNYASGWDTLIAYISAGTTYQCGGPGYTNQHSIQEYPLIGG